MNCPGSIACEALWSLISLHRTAVRFIGTTKLVLGIGFSGLLVIAADGTELGRIRPQIGRMCVL